MPCRKRRSGWYCVRCRPRLGPLRIASAYRASQAQAKIGGDLYAGVRTHGATRLIIGDVSGKGLAAIDDAGTLLGAFRESAHWYDSLPELAAHLEVSVGRHLQGVTDGDHNVAERFITALLLEIPDDHSAARVVSCGHPPPILARNGSITFLDSRAPAPPLGLSSVSPADHHADTFQLGEGDTLLLYTDGIIEARDRAGTFYPVTDRIAGWGWDEPQHLIDRILADLLTHVDGHLDDDAAMLALDISPPTTRDPAVRPAPSPARTTRRAPARPR